VALSSARTDQAFICRAAPFHLAPVRFWKSKATGANYPIGWRIEIPELQLHFAVRAVLDNQELALNPLTYWEGAIELSGMQNEKPISGRGYLELTGYAASLQELQR
jgi:predicted secreted hydrolase